jgi:hypothetical protein
MAARLRKTHQDEVRSKIQTSQLINRLQNHALGEIELEQTQIKAIEVLIRKTLPDLSSVQLSGDPDGEPIDYRISARSEIAELFGPTSHLIEATHG